jgi:UPF0755 protein
MIARWTVAILCLAASALLLFIGYRATRNVAGWALPSTKAVPAEPSTGGSGTVTVTIGKGENARSIGSKLQQAGVIRSASWFRMLAEIEGIQNDLAAGSYTFQPDSDTQAVLDRVKVGILEPQILVTIPEGLRIEQIADLLEKKGVYQAQPLLDAMRSGSFNDDLLKDRPEGTTLEGYIFPDTYYFPAKTNPTQVINGMLKALDDRFDPDLRAAIQAEGLTDYQALTLASIVEREAQVPSERPIIASVFLNRLKKQMPLQADPTVQFAVTQDPASVTSNGWWKRDLTVDDLKIQSPYNTYVSPGLPPGPICNPGRDAIAAVAHPAQTDYLFFVAKGDGSHAFASTLAEHNANIQKYQKR